MVASVVLACWHLAQTRTCLTHSSSSSRLTLRVLVVVMSPVGCRQQVLMVLPLLPMMAS